MSNMKKKLWIIAIIFLLLSILVIEDTFAIFETNSNGDVELDIGKWHILVNGLDLVNGETVSTDLDEFIYTTNSNVKDGYIAPGRSGYYDIEIDPTGTEVAILYDLSFTSDEIFNENITYDVEIVGATGIVRTGENTYSGIISLDDIEEGDTVTLRVSIDWVNDSAYDDDDTELGMTPNNSISIPVELHVVQYLGETLTPYVEEEPESELDPGEIEE